jgi:hypothetical protein
MDSLKQSGILRALSPMSGVRGVVRLHQTLSRTRGNRLLCSPFTNTSIGSWWSTLGGIQDTYRYIEHALGPQQHGFQIMYDPTDTLEIGRGYYVVTLPNTEMVLQGNLKEGTMNFPVTWTVDPLNRSASGWNLVGNPYLCPINWNSTLGWQKSGISNAVFYLDPRSGQQVGYINGVGTLGAGPVIAPGQGFWIKGTGLPTQLVLDESAKTAQSGKYFRETQDFQGYRIILEEKGEAIAESLIRIEPGTSCSVEQDWDLEYPGPLVANYLPQIWLKYQDSLNLLIQSLDKDFYSPECEICLDLPYPGQWNVRIQAEKEEGELRIEQAFTKIEGASINENQISTDRPIQICPWKLVSDFRPNQEQTQNPVSRLKVYPNPVQTRIPLNWEINPKTHSEEELTLKMIDPFGRVVFREKTREHSGNIHLGNSLNPGVYHFEVLGNNLHLSTSVIIFQKN